MQLRAKKLVQDRNIANTSGISSFIYSVVTRKRFIGNILKKQSNVCVKSSNFNTTLLYSEYLSGLSCHAYKDEKSQ